MRYCHEFVFDPFDNIAHRHLRDLIEYHARTCARDADDDWAWEWGDDRVVVRFKREADMLLSARTFEQQHDFFSDKFRIPGNLYRATAVYKD